MSGDICPLSLGIALFNLNSLSNKVSSLLYFVNNFCSGVGILCICESWLTPLISSSAVAIPGFTLFRNDSPSGIAKHGVAIYVKNDIRVDQVYQIFPNTLALAIGSLGITILLVYRPPSVTLSDTLDLFDFLRNFDFRSEIILLGDFNIPSIDWTCDPPSSSSSVASDFLDLISSLGLTQWVKNSTMLRSNNILDLIFTSEVDRIDSIDFAPPFSTCDHIPLVFNYIFSTAPRPSSFNVNLGFDWFRSDFISMNSFFSNTDWDSFIFTPDHDLRNRSFVNTIFQARDMFTPLKHSNSKKEPWLKSVPSSYKRSVQLHWSRYKHIRSTHGRHSIDSQRAWFDYRDSSRSLKSACNSAISDYELSLVKSPNQKRFHHYLRNKRKNAPSIGPLLSDGVSTGCCAEMSRILVNTYSSVFTSDDPPAPQAHQLSDSRISLPEILPSDVFEILSKLRASASCGPDYLPDILFKKCAASLAYPSVLVKHPNGLVVLKPILVQ